MILPIVRTAMVSLRRDRAALALSFLLPIAFFSIFASIFGGQRDSTPKINLIVVDDDQSPASQQLVRALQREASLAVALRPSSKDKPQQPDYTAASAEAAVKAGDAPVALLIPKGFGQNPIAFGPPQDQASLQLLNDASDLIAPQIVTGLLQKAAMTSMPLPMAEEGMKYSERYLGGLTPEQRSKMQSYLADLREKQSSGALESTQSSSNAFSGGIVAVHARAVVGENKKSPMVSFYAAAIGVMFLLFTASGSAGVLLDEADSGTLDRVLSSQVTMTSLLAGKLVYNSLLAFLQLTVMFLWAWAIFHVDLFSHIPGFVVMGLCTAVAVASFGMLLASMCQTRAQLGAVSTLLILIMSSLGGSMFPRYFMPPAMQKAGLLTINAWAIDGFTKVFWRDLPVTALWPQVSVLLAAGIVLFAVARRIARRWEFS
ncbi:MAG TPA: ABC transporter permease [Terracidiphilus sp.]|jgi:ABC-2 type transport system permease protein|nr:ABC transporter permease [Terracidiphilus sp.]